MSTKTIMPTQLGTAFGADFEESTWTFLMPEGYKVAAGEFYIVDKPVYDELLEMLNEIVNAGQEALDYKDGSGRPILQEAIWKAKNIITKATGEKEQVS